MAGTESMSLDIWLLDSGRYAAAATAAGAKVEGPGQHKGEPKHMLLWPCGLGRGPK